MDRKIVVAGFVVLSVVVAASVVSQLALVGLLVWQAGLQPSYGELLEGFIDEQIDAGWHDTAIRADDPMLAQRKLFLGHTVNARSAKEIATKLMYLDSLDGGSPIELFISTQGGYTDSAFTIIDAMQAIEAPVNTWAIGGCYSAGALVLAAGTGTRIASENAIIMVHASLADSTEPFSYDRLDLERYERTWRDHAELPEEWFPMTSDEAYYLTPDEALEMGMVDGVLERVEAG